MPNQGIPIETGFGPAIVRHEMPTSSKTFFREVHFMDELRCDFCGAAVICSLT